MEDYSYEKITSNVRQFIIDNANFDGYEIDENKHVIQNLFDVWMSEHGHYRKTGYTQDFKEWLMGLPSVLTVPFYYSEIRKIIKETFKYSITCHSTYDGKTTITEDFSWIDKKSDSDLSDFYFHLISKVFMAWYFDNFDSDNE